MRVNFAGVPPAPNVPAGIRIDRLDPELDVAAAFDAHHEAFADLRAAERPQSFGTGSSTRRSLTGSCRSSRGTGGWLPGTCSPGWTRRRGRFAVTSRHSAHVATTAARGTPRRCWRVFRTLLDRGKRGCDLHVDSDSLTGATRLYERVGMTAHPRSRPGRRIAARVRPRVVSDCSRPVGELRPRRGWLCRREPYLPPSRARGDLALRDLTSV